MSIKGPLNTEVLRDVLARHCAANLELIDRQFVYSNAEERAQVHTAVQRASSWRRMWKRFADDTAAMPITRPAIERAFDCAPLDDSLRGYAYTDMNDSKILGIVVQGE